MKKIALILMCSLFMLCACQKKDPNVEYVDVGVARDSLFDIGNQVYEKNEYKTFTKDQGMYFISLVELDKLGYDVSIFNRVDGYKCDFDQTGIYIDIDNIQKLQYAAAPVMVNVVCN